MKKRILIATISVIVLICTILAVSVWAADTEAPKLKIAAKNLSFSDSVYIVYYVDAQNASASDVKLLVWDTPQTEYTVQNASTALPCLYTETISGKTYLRFEYRALAAKQMADTVYTRAYVSANGQSYYSDLTSYSILQYAYNKLGKTGSAPTTNENLKTLLTDMLSYGASAQRYFNYNTDRLATDTFYQINTVGSTLPDGTTSGLFKNGESFTLTAPAPAQGFTFSGWKTSGGILVSTANSISVTVNGSNETYSAIYCADDVSNYSKTVVAPTANDDGYTLYYCEGCGDSYRADYVPATGSIGLAYTVNSDGETCTITGKGSCNDTELNIPAYIGNYKVTEIGGSAFRGDTTLRSVRISEGITSIGTSAFSNCTALYTVFLPESLETISSYAFYNCSYLTTHLTIPKNVSSIGGRAFYGCTKLKEIYYEGTADEWNAITIGALNAPLTSATLHCTYKQNITFINEGTATIDAIKDNTYTSMFPISNQLIKKDGYNGKGNATAWVSYSNKGIYIYAEVKDDTVSVTSGVDGDLFQVYVDFVNDHVSTGLAGNDYRTKHGTSGSKKLGWIAIKPDGTSTPSWGFSGVTIESAAKTITGGYAVEFFVPFHTSTLPGTSFGMGFEVKDDTDNDGSRDSVYYDSASGTQYYMNYDKLTDYSFFEDNTPSVEKVEYSSVKIALDGQKDAAYRTEVEIASPWSLNPANSKGYGKAWLSQDGNGLYIYAEAVDSTIFNNDDNDAGEGDRIQVYLDFANDHASKGLTGTSYRNTAAAGTSRLGYIAVSPDGDYSATYGFSGITGIKVATKTIGGGYAVEIYVPFADESVMSKTIGIGFEIHDDTDGVIGSNGKHSREAIFFDKEDGISYWQKYELLSDFDIEETPVLTSFCFSDVHNNFTMLEPPYVIRGTAVLAIDTILATEGKVDVAVIGGDYMSDYPHWNKSGWLPYEYYLGYKAKTLETFAKIAKGEKVIYAAGNHDYGQGELSTDGPGTNGSYNSFDFYFEGDGMKQTMGELSEDNMLWKIGTHTGEKYLICYYYEVNGIGFAGLSPDPDIIWADQGDGMSEEALAWLDAKLDEVDPDGTKVIFINCHYPIDGRSPTGSSHSAYHGEKLTPIFLGHNNLFHLYGHWETWFNNNTVNNLFHYDTTGKLANIVGNETSSDQVLAPDKRGFNAVYMGHFRPMQGTHPTWFYDDPIYGYGGYSTQSAYPSTATPKIAQGMYIEVFEDRVVFTMKNFGILPGFETGTELTPYTVYLNK